MVERDWVLDRGVEGFVGDLSIAELCRLGDALVAESGITVFTRSGREIDSSVESGSSADSDSDSESHKE